MTPTEKKYVKNVGKLFIARSMIYDQHTDKYVYKHDLCMVQGIQRGGWQGKGAYLYTVNTLTPVQIEWKKDYHVRCTEFINSKTTRTYYGKMEYIPLTPENEELIGKFLDVPEMN